MSYIMLYILKDIDGMLLNNGTKCGRSYFFPRRLVELPEASPCGPFGSTPAGEWRPERAEKND